MKKKAIASTRAGGRTSSNETKKYGSVKDTAYQKKTVVGQHMHKESVGEGLKEFQERVRNDLKKASEDLRE